MKEEHKKRADEAMEYLKFTKKGRLVKRLAKMNYDITSDYIYKMTSSTRPISRFAIGYIIEAMDEDPIWSHHKKVIMESSSK